MDRYIFADEAGCFTFERKPSVSRYFILCTITTPSLKVGLALHKLRHKLLWEGAPVGDYFHATTDAQAMRDRVFAELDRHLFNVQATVCEKAKALPRVRVSRARFYKYPWFYHFKHGIGPHVTRDMRLLVTAASLGTKKERATFTNAIEDVSKQTVRAPYCVDFRPSQADPCLQAADYCAWAIQRKWEKSDHRSYDLIGDRMTYEYDLWKHGTTLHY